MTEQEKAAFEQEVREKVHAEQVAKARKYKSEWRAKNREHLRQYEQLYRLRKKMCKEV